MSDVKPEEPRRDDEVEQPEAEQRGEMPEPGRGEVLEYASVPVSALGAEPVRLCRNISHAEAHLLAGRLEEFGVRCAILGEAGDAVLGTYMVGMGVDVLVAAVDEPLARAVMEGRAQIPDDVVDAEGNVIVEEDDGSQVRYVPVQTFESATDLRDAATALGASGIDFHEPAAVRRTPPGPGPYVLRVVEEDLERAKQLLEERGDDDEEKVEGDLPYQRCPKCGSWRVMGDESVGRMMKSLLSAVGLTKEPTPRLLCLKCKHSWEVTE